MKSPYQDLPKEAYWRSAVAERHPLTTAGLYRKKFDIDGTQPVATAGSCFAQHIARHMKQRGFDVLDKEPAPRGMTQEDGFRFGYGMYSARYANIYVAQQLLQLAREALGESKPTREQLVWEDDQGRYYDAMRPSVEPEGLGSPEEVLAHRADHLSAVRAVLEEAKVFVFTFGLTESWVLRDTGLAYPTAPGTVAGEFDEARYAFHNFTAAEVLQQFREFKELMESLNNGVKFLLTVSPVPLTATASPHHVLLATTYSQVGAQNRGRATLRRIRQRRLLSFL